MQGEGFNFKTLKREILALSKAVDWETAKKEWSLVDIIESDEPETCLCGHYPIIEICTIANRITKNIAEVGNVCVKRFLGIRSDLVFAGIKRIKGDITKSLNDDSIVFFKEKGVLTDWEYKFLKNTMKKRKLSPRQKDARAQINRKVLAAVQRRGLPGHE